MAPRTLDFQKGMSAHKYTSQRMTRLCSHLMSKALLTRRACNAAEHSVTHDASAAAVLWFAYALAIAL